MWGHYFRKVTKMFLKKSLLTIVALILTITIVFSGCGNTAAPAPSASSEVTSSQAPESSSAAEEKPADRFDEIMDTSGDAGKLTVRFFKMKSGSDVKSGDSSVITFPDGKVMLVDASSPECAQTVVDNLTAMGITKLDAVLASHPHVDHIGGFPLVLEKFPVDMVYRSKLTYDTDTYRKFESLPQEKGIPVTYLAEGDEFDFGGAHIKIYNPEQEISYQGTDADKDTQFINNNSIAMKITYGKSSLFMGGDLYNPGENRIMEKYGEELQSGLMKANHHGDDTSNSRKFIEVIKPTYVAAMHDGIASLDIYKAFTKREATMYISSADGIIKFQGDADGNYSAVTQYDRPATSLLK